MSIKKEIVDRLQFCLFGLFIVCYGAYSPNKAAEFLQCQLKK